MKKQNKKSQKKHNKYNGRNIYGQRCIAKDLKLEPGIAYQQAIQMIDEVFARLGIRVAIKMNNRKILTGIAEIIGTEHTMGCAVEWGAALVEPGVCELGKICDLWCGFARHCAWCIHH